MRRPETDRLLAYGIPADPGVFECVDCGHRYQHETRDTLPPCPRYNDSTHLRAAWRGLASGYENDPFARER